MTASHYVYETGKIVGVRICRRRHFFKSFSVLQVQRESYRSQVPFIRRQLFGHSTWQDLDPNNLAAVHEVLKLLVTIQYEQEQEKPPRL